MGRRKGDVFSEAIVGFFMVAVVAMLAYFTIVISGVDIVAGRTTVRAKIVFDQVGGLKDHDNVMYRGTKVGKVHRVDIAASNLVVTVDIDRNVILRRNCRISVCHFSMLGGNYLMLEEGEGEVCDLASTVFRGETPSDWMRDLSEVARNLRGITGMAEIRGIVTNAQAVSAKALAFADKVNVIAERADVIAAKADEIVTRVNRGEGMVGRMLSSDAKAYDDLVAAIADAKASFADAKESFAKVREVVSKIDRDETIENFHAGVAAFRKAAEGFDAKDTMARANELIGNLNAVAEKMRRGEGTLGKLMNEPGVYDEVNGLIRDCRQIIDNYRDTTPISTFSSLATGAL